MGGVSSGGVGGWLAGTMGGGVQPGSVWANDVPVTTTRPITMADFKDLTTLSPFDATPATTRYPTAIASISTRAPFGNADT